MSSVLATTSGHRKLFQLARNVSTPSVASAGPHSGSTMRKKIRYSPAPSTRAASSRSSGMPSMNWRIRKTPKAPARNGRIRPHAGVRQVHVGHEHEQRHERDERRDHHRRQHHGEEHPLAGELELGQGVAEHRAEQQVAGGDGEGDDRRVEEVPREVEARRTGRGSSPASAPRGSSSSGTGAARRVNLNELRTIHTNGVIITHEPDEQGEVQTDRTRAARRRHDGVVVGDRRRRRRGRRCAVIVVASRRSAGGT